MPSANRSIMINRPITEVFTLFADADADADADAENDPQWRSGVRHIKRQGELGIGTRYHQRVNGPAGRAITADIDVTAYEIGQACCLQGNCRARAPPRRLHVP